MDVSVVIPFRPEGDSFREAAFSYVTKYFATHFPGYQLIVGKCETDEWAKGAAINEGASRADGEILILNDADSVISPKGIAEAVETIRGGRHWVVPHDYVLRLTEEATQRFMASPIDELPRDLGARVVRHPYMGPPGGGINVMSRTSFESVNGMDPRFIGWGGEDISFAKALVTMGTYHWRQTGYPLWHLYHPHPAPDLRGTPESEDLVARYNRADRNREAMRELLFSR